MSGPGYESDIDASIIHSSLNNSIVSNGSVPLNATSFNRSAAGTPINITVNESSLLNRSRPLSRTISPVGTSTPHSVRSMSPIDRSVSPLNATARSVVDPNATRQVVAQNLLRDLMTVSSGSLTAAARPMSATASASAILNSVTLQAQPNYIDNLLSAPFEANVPINSALVVADPIHIDTLDPARMVATQRLKELAIEHLRVQEADLNAMLLLKKEQEALQDRIQLRRERLEHEHQCAQELLQQKLKANMRAIRIDADNRRHLIQKSQEALNEYGQMRSQKFMEAQQKVIADYTKLMQKRP
jgi:hypothetical protein